MAKDEEGKLMGQYKLNGEYEPTWMQEGRQELKRATVGQGTNAFSPPISRTKSKSFYKCGFILHLSKLIQFYSIYLSQIHTMTMRIRF
jgi:hypothetical protein